MKKLVIIPVLMKVQVLSGQLTISGRMRRDLII